jgi:transposase
MMPIQSSLFPPLQNETIRAAETVSGKNIYLTIGDQFKQLLADIELPSLDPAGTWSASTLAALALVTVFQFAEDLPDRLAAEAARTRPDWKYALHLSLNQPGISPSMLCEFRQSLLRSPAARQTFQQVFDRLAETDLLSKANGRQTAASEVVAVVCGVSRLERLIEAIRMALEVVAATEPEQLRMITLPHWYERYGRLQATRALPKSLEEQTVLAHAIGADAAYLLEAIAQSDSHLTSLPEARALHETWLEQFDRFEHRIQWRTSACASCFSP